MSSPSDESEVLPLGAEDRRAALEFARATLTAHLDARAPTPIAPASPALLQHRAAFVTLRDRETDELRGCRGEHRAHRPLIESVGRMVIATATADPRFEPVQLRELPDLRIQISALTPLRPIRPDEVILGRHGLMIVAGSRAGLLLPKVPALYGIETARAFLDALCKKAGLSRGAWSDPAVALYGFEAEEWGE